MRKNTVLLAAMALCASMLTFTSVAMAEEAKEPEVKSTFTIDGTEVDNFTDLVIKEGVIETVTEGDEEIANVILTDEEGKEHTFEKVDVEDWRDLKFVIDYEMYYIQYIDVNEKNREAEENVDEIIWDEPITMYAKGNINVRTAPENNAEAVYYTSLGEEYQVLGIAPGWFKIKVNDEITGYIYHKYITEDKAVVDELIAEAEAEAAAAAEAYYYDDTPAAPAGGNGGGGGQQGCLTNGLIF